MFVSKKYKDLLLSVGEGGGATRQAITKAEIEQFRISYPANIDEQKLLIEKFDKQKFAEAIFKTLFEKKFEDKQNWAEFLKKRYDVKNEAELIVEKAKKDFSKLS